MRVNDKTFNVHGTFYLFVQHNYTINNYSSDHSLTVERVTPIFMNVKYWPKIGRLIVIPDARVAVIRRKYSLQYVQLQAQAALYYVNCYDGASWSDLATKLHRGKESAAIKTFIS